MHVPSIFSHSLAHTQPTKLNHKFTTIAIWRQIKEMRDDLEGESGNKWKILTELAEISSTIDSPREDELEKF